jgi:hypothetical protein
MKKAILAAAVATAAGALPASASAAEPVCAGNTSSLGACVTADVACVVGSLKGLQYYAPCVRMEIYREVEPPGGA